MLLQGLTTLRARYSTAESLWGIRELNLASNRLDDVGLEAVLGYAKKDVCCERVMVQGNEISVSVVDEASVRPGGKALGPV